MNHRPTGHAYDRLGASKENPMFALNHHPERTSRHLPKLPPLVGGGLDEEQLAQLSTATVSTARFVPYKKPNVYSPTVNTFAPPDIFNERPNR